VEERLLGCLEAVTTETMEASKAVLQLELYDKVKAMMEVRALIH
jgi:hypothetical protein